MIQSKFNKFLLKNNKSLELSTEKDDKVTELNSDTFKSAINKSREYDNDTRTYKLGSLFYNSFIGKEFLGGIITNIGVHSPLHANHTDISIEYKIQNKLEYLYYDVKLDSYGNIKDIKMSRKDARLLSLIALKINPESKYKEISKNFSIDYNTNSNSNSKIEQTPQPKKYNDFETVFTVGHVYNHSKYGNGKIIKDTEGLCKSGEVMFQPFDNSKLGLNLLGNDERDKALWNDYDKAKYDIVDTKDLSLTESVNNMNPNVKYQKINMLDEYKINGYDKEYEKKFNIFKKGVKGFTDINNELNLKTGDIVSYISGYNDDIIYTSKILGFDSDGKAFILKESYWFAIDLSKKMVTESAIVNESSTINILKNKFKEKYFDEKTKTWKEDVTRTLVIDFLSKNKINLTETDALLNTLNKIKN